MTYRYGRIARVHLANTAMRDGVSLKATEHLTEPRSYAGTPAAVPPQIYTDEDCSNMPQAGPRNFAERSYAGVYRDEDCDDTPMRGPRNFGERSYARTKRRRVKRRRKRKTLRRTKKKSARGECSHLFDDTKPLGGKAYTDCILDLLR